MQNKKWFIILPVVLVGLFVAGWRGMTHVMANQAVNVRPFVFTTTHYVVENGVEKTTAEETVARSRDGALAYNTTAYSNGQTFRGMRRVQSPDGFYAMIADTLQLKSSGHRSDATLAKFKQGMLSTPTNCVEKGGLEKLAGEDVLFGWPAKRITVTQNNSQMTAWRLPDFNCETVQVAITGAKTMGYRLTSFAEKDPEPALFNDFNGYKEMAPSQLLQQYTGKPVPPAQATALDKSYAEHNK